MKAEDRGNMAVVAFVKALGVTIAALEDLPQSRTAAGFLWCLDEILGELKGMPEKSGPAVFQDVQILRDNLDKAIGQARLARMPDGGKTH